MEIGTLGRRAAVVVAAAVTMTGCAEASSSAPTRPSAQASSSRLNGPTFTSVIPVGWTDASRDTGLAARVHASGPVLVLLIATPGSPVTGLSDVRATIVVSRIDAGPIPSGAAVDYLDNVSHSGASNLSTAQQLNIAGEAAVAITYDHTIAGTAGKARDVLITHKGETYEIVMDGGAADFATGNAALNAILDRWAWTDLASPTAPPS